MVLQDWVTDLGISMVRKGMSPWNLGSEVTPTCKKSHLDRSPHLASARSASWSCQTPPFTPRRGPKSGQRGLELGSGHKHPENGVRGGRNLV